MPQPKIPKALQPRVQPSATKGLTKPPTITERELIRQYGSLEKAEQVAKQRAEQKALQKKINSEITDFNKELSYENYKAKYEKLSEDSKQFVTKPSEVFASKEYKSYQSALAEQARYNAAVNYLQRKMQGKRAVFPTGSKDIVNKLLEDPSVKRAVERGGEAKLAARAAGFDDVQEYFDVSGAMQTQMARDKSIKAPSVSVKTDEPLVGYKNVFTGKIVYQSMDPNVAKQKGLVPVYVDAKGKEIMQDRVIQFDRPEIFKRQVDENKFFEFVSPAYKDSQKIYQEDGLITTPTYGLGAGGTPTTIGYYQQPEDKFLDIVRSTEAVIVPSKTLGRTFYIPTEADKDKLQKLLEESKWNPKARFKLDRFLSDQEKKMKLDIREAEAINKAIESGKEIKDLSVFDRLEYAGATSPAPGGMIGTGWQLGLAGADRYSKEGKSVNLLGLDVSGKAALVGLKGSEKAYDISRDFLLFQGAGVAVKGAGVVPKITGGAKSVKALQVASTVSAGALGVSFAGLSTAQEYKQTGDIGLAVGAGVGTGAGFFGSMIGGRMIAKIPTAQEKRALRFKEALKSSREKLMAEQKAKIKLWAERRERLEAVDRGAAKIGLKVPSAVESSGAFKVGPSRGMILGEEALTAKEINILADELVIERVFKTKKQAIKTIKSLTVQSQTVETQLPSKYDLIKGSLGDVKRTAYLSELKYSPDVGKLKTTSYSIADIKTTGDITKGFGVQFGRGSRGRMIDKKLFTVKGEKDILQLDLFERGRKSARVKKVGDLIFKEEITPFGRKVGTQVVKVKTTGRKVVGDTTFEFGEAEYKLIPTDTKRVSPLQFGEELVKKAPGKKEFKEAFKLYDEKIIKRTKDTGEVFTEFGVEAEGNLISGSLSRGKKTISTFVSGRDSGLKTIPDESGTIGKAFVRDGRKSSKEFLMELYKTDVVKTIKPVTKPKFTPAPSPKIVETPAPKIITTPAPTPSIYSGMGLYERTDATQTLFKTDAPSLIGIESYSAYAQPQMIKTFTDIDTLKLYAQPQKEFLDVDTLKLYAQPQMIKTFTNVDALKLYAQPQAITPKLTYEQEVITSSVTPRFTGKTTIREKVPPKPIPPKPPVPFGLYLPGERPEFRKEKLTGYHTSVKDKGKWRKVTQRPHTRAGAIDVGARIVDNTTSAGWKIDPIKKTKTVKGKKIAKIKVFKGNELQRGDDYYARTKPKYRDFKIFKGKQVPMKNQWVEKRNRRSDTVGETRGLGVSQLLARRKKRATGLPTRKKKGRQPFRL